jgi:hypothetical protein
VLNHDGIENYHAGGLQARERAVLGLDENAVPPRRTQTPRLLRLENAHVLQVLDLGDFL